jgi:RimJ/RimL family protein N-acetyltransferase
MSIRRLQQRQVDVAVEWQEMNKNICRISGDRIYLSVLRDDDFAVSKYVEWMSDEATCVNIKKNSEVVDVTRMPGWVVDHSVMRMGIVHRVGDTIIGYCHIDHRAKDYAAWLSINIGDRSCRGQGIGEEVTNLLCEYCFNELGVHSVHLDVLSTNASAIWCYQKCGFVISGKYRGHGFHDGHFNDWLHMDMLVDEWKMKHPKKESGDNVKRAVSL